MSNVVRGNFDSKGVPPEDEAAKFRKLLLKDFADKGVNTRAVTAATELIVEMTMEAVKKLRGPHALSLPGPKLDLQMDVEQQFDAYKAHLIDQVEKWTAGQLDVAARELLSCVGGACAAVVNALMFPEKCK